MAAQGRVYDFFDESWARPSRWAAWSGGASPAITVRSTPRPWGCGGCGTECGTGWRSPTMTPGPRVGREPTESTPTPWSGWRGDGPSGRWWPTVGGQLYRDPAPAGMAGGKGRQRRAGRYPNHRRTAAAGEAGDLPGLRRRPREFTLYCWDEKAGGDRVKKVHDHTMDDIRYFAASVAAGERGYVGGLCVERGRF